MRGVDRGRDQSGRNEHEHGGGDTEEAREVEPHASAVDPPADRDRDEHAEQGARAGGGRVARGLEGGEQEDRGLEPLAQHREEGHRDQRDRRALGQRMAGARAEIRREAASVPAHPDDHEGDHADRDRRDDGLELLLLTLRKRLIEHLQCYRNADAQRHSEQDTGPHGAKRIPAALLAQERGDDAYDQRGLDSFSQPDHERRQHDHSLIGHPNVREP